LGNHDGTANPVRRKAEYAGTGSQEPDELARLVIPAGRLLEAVRESGPREMVARSVSRPVEQNSAYTPPHELTKGDP